MEATWCIPSYRRPDGCASRTLALLRRLGVLDTAMVEVWLSDPAEHDAYAAAMDAAGLYAAIRSGEPTLRANRAAAMHLHRGEPVMFADDDIDDLLVLAGNGASLRPAGPEDAAALLAAGFGECGYHGLRMWGVAPVANHYFLRRTITAGRSFCIGSLYGLVVPDDPAPYVTAHDEKEDYERSLRAAELDGGVVRANWVAPRSTYYQGAGGMVDGRTVEAQEAAVQFIETRWPGATRRNHRRKSPYPEIVINPRRLR